MKKNNIIYNFCLVIFIFILFDFIYNCVYNYFDASSNPIVNHNQIRGITGLFFLFIISPFIIFEMIKKIKLLSTCEYKNKVVNCIIKMRIVEYFKFIVYAVIIIFVLTLII